MDFCVRWLFFLVQQSAKQQKQWLRVRADWIENENRIDLSAFQQYYSIHLEKGKCWLISLNDIADYFRNKWFRVQVYEPRNSQEPLYLLFEWD